MSSPNRHTVNRFTPVTKSIGVLSQKEALEYQTIGILPDKMVEYIA